MKKLLFLVGLVLTAFFFYYCISNHKFPIQSDVTNRVTAATELPEGTSLSVDGRDVTLKGVVSSQDIKDMLGKQAASVYGVRVVNNLLGVSVPVEPVAYVEPEPVVDVVPEPVVEVVPEPVVEVVPEPAPAPVVTSVACEQNLAAILEREKVNFSSSQAVIKKSSYPVLNMIVDAAKKCEVAIIDIHGHTDSSGAREFNRTLSLNRAKAVGNYLIDNGVKQMIRVFGHGPDKPIADNATVAGRAQNRRIEFKVEKLKN